MSDDRIYRMQSLGTQLDILCDAFETAWRRGERESIEAYLSRVPLMEQTKLLGELLQLEVMYRRKLGEQPSADEYRVRFPEQTSVIDEVFAVTPAGDPQATAAHVSDVHPAAEPDQAAAEQLLCGLLGVQWNLFGKEACERALAAWQQNRSGPLAQILENQGMLDAPRRKLLDGLLKKCLEQHAGDPVHSLESLSSLGSWADQLRPQLESGLQTTLVHVGQAHRGVEPGVVPTLGRSRFRILKPHARGGLGEVFLAQDEELDREVAVKEIQARFADDADSRSRFVQEAEITGKLEHPGIVPVYGLGAYDDGRPYYAMRFIQGDNLKDAIERFHDPKRKWKDAGERELEFRKLLQRFIDVCNAVEYAHSRGVLHRDLKPGNIMLGKYGETLVVDWGLAKPMGRREPRYSASEEPLRPKSGSNAAMTQMGSAVGTPAFMSPEQAAGNLDELGPASDVYSLGATFFALLAGKPPIQGDTLAEQLENVRTGKITAFSNEVPKPLASICRRAMAQKASDRYPSARALADDVEHWLADERVAAYDETFVERTRRWVRTHRNTVTTLTALTATTIVALIVGLLVVSAEKRETERAAELAELRQYRADITLVRNALEAGDLRTAELALAQCPARHRAWEYEYFQRVLRDFLIASFSVPDAKTKTNDISSIALHPGKELLATRRGHNETVVWNYRSRQIVNTLNLPQQENESKSWSPDEEKVMFSPDGRFLACTRLCDVHIYDADTFKFLRTMSLPQPIGNLAFSPGSEMLAVKDDKSIVVWNTATWTAGSPIPFDGMRLEAMCFTPDGKTLISSELWNMVVIDVATGEKRREIFKEPNLMTKGGIHGNDLEVNGICCTPDGKRLVAAFHGGTVRVWDIESEKRLQILDIGQGTQALGCLLDGNRLAVAASNGEISYWDLDIPAVNTSTRRFKDAENHWKEREFAGTTTAARLGAARYQPLILMASLGNNGVFAIATRNSVAVCNAKSVGRRLSTVHTFDKPIGISIGPQSKVAYGAVLNSEREKKAGIGEKALSLFDPVTGLVAWTSNVPFLDTTRFSPDGNYLIAVGDTLRVIDVHTGQVTLTTEQVRFPDMSQSVIDKQTGKSTVTSTTLRIPYPYISESKEDEVTVFYTSEDTHHPTIDPLGRYLLCDNKPLRIWDLKSGEKKAAIEFREALRPNQATEGWTQVGDGGKRHWKITENEDFAKGIFFGPNPNVFFSSITNGTIRCFEVTTGKETASQPAIKDVKLVGIAPDGSLVTEEAKKNYALRSWPERELKIAFEHDGLCTCIAFHPDGNRAATGGEDGKINLWHLPSGEKLLTFEHGSKEIVDVEFVTDGTGLAAVDLDGKLQIWK